MVAVDPSAPTPEEHLIQAVTKLRYMQFRERQSSTCSQGFRIEAMKLRGAPPVTDLKKVKTRKEVEVTLALFLAGREDTRRRIVSRLMEIRAKLEQSEYFRTHEVISDFFGAWEIFFLLILYYPQVSRVLLFFKKKCRKRTLEVFFFIDNLTNNILLRMITG